MGLGLLNLPEILCVLVRHADGEEVWTPLADYESNPAAGSYIVQDARQRAPLRS